MAKSWKSFVKPTGGTEQPAEQPVLPDMAAMAAQNEALQQLLEERKQLEEQMQELTGQPKTGQQQTGRFDNDIPLGSEKRTMHSGSSKKPNCSRKKKSANRHLKNGKKKSRRWRQKFSSKMKK
jgi:hypothetical protein